MASTASPSGQAVHTHVNFGSGRQIAHSGIGPQHINEGPGDYYHNSPHDQSVHISVNLFKIVCCMSNPGAADEGRNRNNTSLSRVTSPVLARRRHQSVDRNIMPVRSTSSHDRSSSVNASSQLGSDTHTRKSILTFIRTWLWNPYKRDAQGRTALHDASRSGPLLVRHSLNNGELHLLPGLRANIDLTDFIDASDKQGRTPVHHVTIRGDFCSLYILAEKGANLELADKDGRRVLHIASKTGHFSMVDYLLDKGVWLEARDKRGLTALHLAAMGGHDVAVRSILRKAAQGGIRTLRREKEDFYSWTPVHYAVLTMQLKAVVALVEELDDEGDLNIQDYQGRTALHLACAIPTQVQSPEQCLPHHEACQLASAIVRVLVDAGVQLDAQDSMGFTALMYAAQRANVGAVRCLVYNDADVNVVDGRGDDNSGRHNRTARAYAEQDAPLGEDRDEVLRILSSGQPGESFLRRL